MVDVVSATEFHRLESWTASNRYQCDIVRGSIGMPISNFIKMVYLRRLFRFRSRYMSAVELSTSFQQPNSVVADIKTTKWHFRFVFADINIDIYMMQDTEVELAVESYLSISLATYFSDIERLTSFWQRHYMVSLSTSGAISTLHKNNDIETIS